MRVRICYGVYMMHDVGIRELRAGLADVIERAAGGERIRITDRGQPKALIVPLPGRDKVEEGFAAGWISKGPAWGKPLPPLSRKRPRPIPGMSVQAAIDEDRGS
jgi:prevent-host-death family protein